MLPGTYPSDAEGRGRLELLWRRSSAAASMAATRRRYPEPKERARVIKTGSRDLTDAAREKNREEKGSPEQETKMRRSRPKEGNSKISSNLHGRNQIKG